MFWFHLRFNRLLDFGIPLDSPKVPSVWYRQMGFQSQVGNQIVPLISENLEGGDAASFRRRRYVELKHGRVPVAADQWTECTVWLSCSDIGINTSLNSLNAHNAHNPVISISFDRWPCSLALATSFLSTTAGQETCLLPLAWSSAHLGCKKDFETWHNYWCQD